jgi:hypothetical protein
VSKLNDLYLVISETLSEMDSPTTNLPVHVGGPGIINCKRLTLTWMVTNTA